MCYSYSYPLIPFYGKSKKVRQESREVTHDAGWEKDDGKDADEKITRII